MTDAELRTHFDLKPCKNPPHAFRIWRLLGEWIWAGDCWSQLVGQHLQTMHVSFHSICCVNGTKAYSIVIWRLKIIWGIT